MEIPYTTKPRPDTGLYNAKVGIWLFLASEVMLFGALFSSYIILRIGAPEGTWLEGVLNVPIGFVNTLVLIFSSVTVVMAWANLKMKNFARFKLYQGITIACAFTFLIIKTFEYSEKFHHYEVWFKDGTSVTGHFDHDWLHEVNGHDEDGESLPFFKTRANMEAHGVTEFAFIEDASSHGHSEEGAEHADSADERSGEESGHHEASMFSLGDVKRLSAYVPAHSTYFAIYFTLTALHGLHVLVGACVMAYFLFLGHKMWKKDPERQTNRIEVGGLFWHFVDLVWIFLFPVLYLL